MIGLILSGLINRLAGAATALLGIVRRHPWQCALIATLCACVWLWRGKSEALAERDTAIAGRAADRAAYASAMAEAERLHRESRANTETLSRNIAHAADETARHLDADSRRNLADRVRTKAPACVASGAASPAMSDNPGDPAGADPGSVSFTHAEADALRRHELRSVTCNGWALDLIAGGLAVAP